MVRRVDPNGEATVWCRKSSGYAGCRLAPKLMNRGRQDKKDTKEHNNTLKTNLKVKKERYQTGKQKGGKLRERRGEPQGRGCKRLTNNWGRTFHGAKRARHIAKKRLPDYRGALNKEEGNVSVSEYNFLRSWLREMPPQARETWPGPPSALPPDVAGEGPQRWQIGLDVNPSWPRCAREGALLKKWRVT